MLNSLPNILTMSRIVVIPLVVLFMYMDQPFGNWMALGAFAVAGITDFFDGYLARMWGQQSSFGKFLDPIADKLLIASILLVLVGIDRVEGVTLLAAVVILCREILVSGLREFLAEVQVSVPVSQMAKWKTAIQMVALGFLLVGPAGPTFGPLTSTEVGAIGLWGAAVLTLVTGYDYLRAGLRHIRETDDAAKATSGAKSGADTKPDAGK